MQSGDINNSSRNAIKHGACAVTTLILANESHDDYLKLEQRTLAAYGHRGANAESDTFEIGLIRALARAEWVYLRSENNYLETEAAIMNKAPNGLSWTEDDHRALARFQRYRTANHNLFLKARKAVDDVRKARHQDQNREIKFHRDNEKMAMAKDRLELYREKNKPWDFEEELEQMREKSIRLGFLNPDGTPGPRKS